MKTNLRLLTLAVLLPCTTVYLPASPLGTAFTYQGRLADGGNAVNGTYDLRFNAYDALSGGTLVGGPLTNAAVGITNGFFTVTLNFGAVFTGNACWLDVGVRTNGGGAFTTLSPRQPLTPSPYALYAPNAGAAATAATAASANSVAAVNITGTLALGQLPGAVLTNNQAGVTLAGTFSGNGAGLTNLNATQLATGTIADARLSANVALRSANQTFTGTNVFSSKVAIGKTTPATALDVNGTATATAFVGNAAALTNLNGAAIQNATIGTAQLAAGAVTSVNIASNTITAANLAPGVGIVPPGTFVLSATASNAALLAAGFNPQRTVAGVAWTQATNAASGVTRYSFGAVTNSGQMWVMGGYGGSFPGSYLRDVWSSTDGAAWTQVTAAAPWTNRYGFGAVPLNGQTWLFGGFSGSTWLHDVWSSANGVTWIQATNAAPWTARADFAAVAFNGKMWVLGGHDIGGNDCNDVWSSSDGATWTQATNAAPWSGRSGHAAVAFNNQMWMLGGVRGSSFLRDVWSSTNGAIWTLTTSTAGWSGRHAHAAVAFNGQIWVLGGVSGATSFFHDAWSSSDGATWTQATNAAPWVVRSDLRGLAYNNRLWVLGGRNNGGFLGDVWYTQPTFTNMLGNCYLYQKQ